MFACAAGQARSRVFGAEHYANFGELRAAQVEGRDYRIVVKDRKSPVTVFAIHGGEIEPGTSQIAHALAGQDWNLYLFEGLGGGSSRKLHVTAAHFDEPLAVALAGRSGLGISVHRKKGEGKIACVGGGNASARRSVAQALSAKGFRAEEPCLRLPGASPKNIANLPRAGGVQLELSGGLILELLQEPAKRERFRQAVRLAVLQEIRHRSF